MNAGDSRIDDLTAIERQRRLLSAEIQRASAVSPGVLRNPSSVLPLVEALNAAASLEFRARDHQSVSRFATWAVQLCEDALAEESANTSVQNQLLTALGTLRDLHVAEGQLDAAADRCSRITGILDQQFESSDDHREWSLAWVKNQFELARIRRSQLRLDDAALAADQASDLAIELAEEFYDDSRCHEALARCQRLEHEIDVEQRQLIAAAEAEQARRNRQKVTAGAVITLCLVIGAKIAFRVALNNRGNAPVAPVFNHDAIANLFDTTIEFINESPNACTVRLMGHEFGRQKSYTKELAAGPASEIRHSLHALPLDRVIVESAGQIRSSDVQFDLPKRGLAQLKIDANLGVRLIKVSESYRPQGEIAKPVDEGPLRRRRN